MVEPETAGDPMTKRKWVRRSLRTLAAQLASEGHKASAPTVARLLRKMSYSPRVNAKEKERGSQHPERNRQFEYIAEQRARFRAAGSPIISVDTKKKELIGEFRQAGQSWVKEPIAVNVHDFPSEAVGRAVPYGIYDVARNEGAVFVGRSGDTPEFAVSAIARWWEQIGAVAYPQAREVLIVADSGGSNGCRSGMWKEQLQQQLCDRLGLTVTVSHYPRGCSKWNPIEHRLFSQISANWAGEPLQSFKLMLGYIRGTQTVTGLKVRAHMLEGVFATGRRVAKAILKQLHLERHDVCPQWNYTIRPRAQLAEGG
jgi:hypothetical protein